MTTFDEIIPKLTDIFQQQKNAAAIRPILINRDLNGRVRLIVDEKWEKDAHAKAVLDEIARKVQEALGPHAYSAAQALLFESNFEEALPHEIKFSLEGIADVYVVDRLAGRAIGLRFLHRIKLPDASYFIRSRVVSGDRPLLLQPPGP